MSHTFVRQPTTDGSESFIMVPNPESEYYLTHKKALGVLDDLVSHLPDLEYEFDEEDCTDYPVVPDRFLNKVGKFYHIRRPVFFIGGVGFFRRYNDDWNSTVIYSTGTFNGRVSWYTDMGYKRLTALQALVVEKGVENVTYDEVQDIIRM